MSAELAQAITATASNLGIDPVDLATAISYETAGTFDPWKAGPTTKWGQHRGLIQWGEPQRQQYGVTQDMPVPAQLEAVGRYLQDRGVRPGMGLMDVYSAINAGGVGLYNRSDAHVGGAPGTVADKVNNQMAGHRQKAQSLLGQAQPQAPDMASGWYPSSPAPPPQPAPAMPQGQPSVPQMGVIAPQAQQQQPQSQSEGILAGLMQERADQEMEGLLAQPKMTPLRNFLSPPRNRGIRRA